MRKGNNNVFKLSGNLALGGTNDYIPNPTNKKMSSYESRGVSDIKKPTTNSYEYQNQYSYDYKQKPSNSQIRKYSHNQQQNLGGNYTSGANYGSSSYKRIQHNYQNVLNKISSGEIDNYQTSLKNTNKYSGSNKYSNDGYSRDTGSYSNNNNVSRNNRKQPVQYENKYSQNRISQNKISYNQAPTLINRQMSNYPSRNQPPVSKKKQQSYSNDPYSYQPSSNYNQPQIKEYDPSTFVMCRQGCGRKFNPDSISKHQKVCKKVFQNKRKQFDAQQKRLVQKQQKKFMRQGQIVQKKLEQKKKQQTKTKALPKWKAQSLGFRAILKANRRGGQMTQQQKKLVNQAQQSSMVKCKFCGRNFSQKAAQRHIPFCQSQQKKNAIKKKK